MTGQERASTTGIIALDQGRFTAPVHIARSTLAYMDAISRRTNIPTQVLVNACLDESIDHEWGSEIAQI